eukprot:m.82775 g.82775  ORF g.82775 m.82775 type:complete len:82 (-) comp19575_c0_seq1:2233-2478(-)
MSIPRGPSPHTAGAVKIAIFWVGTIIAGSAAFLWARDDIDRQRRERMAIEGPLYRRKIVPREGIRVEDWEKHEAEQQQQKS